MHIGYETKKVDQSVPNFWLLFFLSCFCNLTLKYRKTKHFMVQTMHIIYRPQEEKPKLKIRS